MTSQTSAFALQVWDIAADVGNSAPKITDAHERCAQLVTQLQQAPGLFAELARLNSDCSSKDKGGAFGQVRPGDTVPEFERALGQLEAGQTSRAPLQTRHGWHIIWIEARAEGKALPFDAVKSQIAEAMEKAAWAQDARDFVARLVTSAEIKGIDFSSH